MAVPTRSSDPIASMAADPELLGSWADTGQALLQGLLSATNLPSENRVLRSFRKSEALDIAGISEWRWERWRKSAEPAEGAAFGETRMTLAELHALQESCGTRPCRPEGTAPIRMAVANFKGGASKTMLSLHTAHFLALRGWRVLAIDTDPQGTLTRLCGLQPELVDQSITLSAVFEQAASTEPDSDQPVQLSPLKTHIDGLDIIPASLDMIGADISVAAAFMSRTPASKTFYSLVDRALSTVDEAYDIVILDTAPAFSFAALNTLWAANALLIPVPPSIPDYSSTVDFISMASDIMAKLCELTGIQKQWDPVAVVHSRVGNDAMAETVRRLSSETFGASRLEEVIPKSSAFLNAVGLLRSVYEVTSADMDSRSLRRARESCDRLGRRIEQLMRQVWEQQLDKAARSAEVSSGN